MCVYVIDKSKSAFLASKAMQHLIEIQYQLKIPYSCN